MITPGMSGSQTLSSQADKLYDDIQAIQYGAETLSKRQRRLVEYFHTNRTLFSKKEQDAILGLLQDTFWNGAVTKLERLEMIYRLPRETRAISACDHGKALIDMLQESSYDPVVCKAVYEYTAITSTCIKYGVTTIARRPLYLVGPPGAGKTRLVQKYAETLGLPLLTVCMSSTNDFHSELLGTWSTHHDCRQGIIADFLCNQVDVFGARLPKNIYPIIIFFDEIDKVMNDGGSYLRQFFLQRLNLDVSTQYMKLPGLNGVGIEMDKVILIFGANEPIYISSFKNKDEEEAKEKKADEIFMSRVNSVTFPYYSKEDKVKIIDGIVQDTLVKFGRTTVSDEMKKRVAEFIEADTHPGVRILKANIISEIISHIARDDGWTYPVG
jgi:ATP-dependent Lon protease